MLEFLIDYKEHTLEQPIINPNLPAKERRQLFLKHFRNRTYTPEEEHFRTQLAGRLRADGLPEDEISKTLKKLHEKTSILLARRAYRLSRRAQPFDA